MLHVFYHNDPDGKCGAAIIKRYWKGETTLRCGGDPTFYQESEMKFIEVDYKDDLNKYINEIVSGDIVVAVDFSFKPDIMKRIAYFTGTDNIYWIDHHATAFVYDYGFDPKGLRSDKFSGCELAWKFLNPNKEIPMGVILIGDYDTWAFRFGEDTENFYLGLQLLDLRPESKDWDTYVLSKSKQGDENRQLLADMGRHCKIFRDNFCKQYVKDFGFETTFDGYKAFAVGLYEFGSKVFGDKMNEYDLCLSFEFDGRMWEVGLYSANQKINCGKIAQKYGGGGHPGAAGFPCIALPFSALQKKVDG